ncbi:hypothetical protein N431DRAFT_327868 [Stipitochalara longipes BDJ]|nr:hypothetical protein N431DRAFT_327868 [Stipitochalara longipes BDJ]
MKFSSSTKTAAAAVVFFLQIANAKTMMKSEVFGWQYELDFTAPVITTKEEIYTTADAYNQTVGIELVNGTMMMIDLMQNKQIATFGGAVDEWARANYPGEDIINDTAFIEEMKNKLMGHLDDVRAGIPLKQSLAARSTDSDLANVDPRKPCGCPLLPIACLIEGCKGICLLVLCSSGA